VQPSSAVTALLFGLSAFLLFGAGSAWLKLAREREGSDDRPTIPVHSFRAASAITAAALGLLGIALLWFAWVEVSGA
jgi:hypothetical protein